MTSRFITYVPKPTKAINRSKPQKANRNNGIPVQEPLTEICKSGNNSNVDDDDIYFPTVQELIARRSGGHAISSSSKPQNSEIDFKVRRAADLSKRVRGSLKRDLSESQDSSTDSSSDSDDSDDAGETESKLDSRPAQKKQKTDDSQHRRKQRSTFGVQTVQTLQDKLLAADDTESDYTKGCQDPFNGQDPYDGAIELLGAVCNIDAMDSSPEKDINIMSAPQPATAVVICQESVMALDRQSATLNSPSAISALDDSKMPEQAVEIANDKQVWEICDIIGKQDVDGVLHYWVQWSATLVPKCEMGKARALIARFEARIRAQRKQKGGEGRGRLFQSKAGKQARKGQGRPQKQGLRRLVM